MEIAGFALSLATLALEVYKAYNSASKTLYNLHHDMNSLQATLLMVGQILPKEADLVPLLTGCKTVLVDINQTLSMYMNANTRNKKVWLHFTHSFKDVEQLRRRLTAQVSMLHMCAHLTIARSTYYGREDNGGHLRPRPNSLPEPEEWARIQLALQREKISQSSIEEIKTIVLRVGTRRDSTLPTPPGTPALPATVGVEPSPVDNRSSLSVSEYSVASNKSTKSGNNWLSKCSPKAIFRSMEQRFIDAARSGSTASLEEWAPEIGERTIHKAMIAVCRSKTPADGHAETVSLLFQFGASFEYRDTKYCRTPLIWAVTEGRDDLVQLFLESNAPVEEPDYVQNWTPLLWAIWLGRNTAVDWLIESGADIEVADGSESNTLVMAAKIGNYQAAKSILREDPGLVNSENIDGMTPLAYAVEAADEEFAILLLENHAAAQCTNSKGVPVLTTAVKHESVAIAEMLLNNGATVDARDNQGCTALHWAVWKKNIALVKLLLARQADRTAADHQGWTVRKWAENSGSVDILQLIEDDG